MSRRRGSLIMKLKKTVSAVLAGAMLLGTSAFANMLIISLFLQ